MTKVYRINCDPALMSSGVPFSTPEKIVRCFRDGRPSAFLLQVMAVGVYGYIETTGNARGYDFTSAENLKIELKCLTKKVFFRESGNTGKGRKCCPEDVLRFIRRLDSVVVADVNNFPTYDFIKLTGSTVMDWYHGCLISQKNGGMARKKFYETLGQTEIVRLEDGLMP